MLLYLYLFSAYILENKGRSVSSKTDFKNAVITNTILIILLLFNITSWQLHILFSTFY